MDQRVLLPLLNLFNDFNALCRHALFPVQPDNSGGKKCKRSFKKHINIELHD